MISQDETESYRKLYGDLINCVPHYSESKEENKLELNVFCERGWHSGCDSRVCVCLCHKSP